MKNYKSIKHEVSKEIVSNDKIKIPWGLMVFILELFAILSSWALSTGYISEEITVFGLTLEPDFVADMGENGFLLFLYLFTCFNFVISLFSFAISAIVTTIINANKFNVNKLDNIYRTALITEEILALLENKYPECARTLIANSDKKDSSNKKTQDKSKVVKDESQDDTCDEEKEIEIEDGIDSKVWKCTYCNSINDALNSECWHCGNDRLEPMFKVCPKCGTNQQIDNRYCTQCAYVFGRTKKS